VGQYLNDITLLQCTSTYPTPQEHANLRVIQFMADFPKCTIGYSGHEKGLQVSLGAAAMGAIDEKA